jgi:hypothetical protein
MRRLKNVIPLFLPDSLLMKASPQRAQGVRREREEAALANQRKVGGARPLADSAPFARLRVAARDNCKHPENSATGQWARRAGPVNRVSSADR